MDPTLLQHSSPFDFPISSESKYLGQGRPFSNPSYPANDFPYSGRRPQSALTNGAPGAGVAISSNSNLDFNSSSLLNESPFHSHTQETQLLLSPPDSSSGSASASGNSTASSIVFTTLPKPFPSNAGPTDHFPSAPPSVLSSNWAGSAMTVMDRPRFPPPLSPPVNYNSANGMGTALLSNRSMVDRLPPSYQPNGHSSISPGLFQQPGPRYPPSTYHRNSIGHPYIADGLYPGQNMSASIHEQPSPAKQDGPPFGETVVLYPVLTVRNQQLIPEITASIQKGFFQVDRKWTCYRRNYFAVTCSFTFKNHGAEGPFYLQRNGHEEQIHQFAVSISAKTALTGNGESESRGLVQHTPKRDKATESVPGRHLISPTPNQSMGPNGVYLGAGSLYGGSQHMSSAMMGSYGGAFENSSANSIPPLHTFERIQFQKATANNGKRRAQQQYFLVVVELSANIARSPGEENWVVIATKESDPMVVRGRSPGHYKDNGRRDSQTSMDPDRGSGHGAAEGAPPGSLPPGSYGHPSMGWMAGHRHNAHTHYGGSGSTYRQAQAMENEYSPASMASSSTLTETSTEADLNPSETLSKKSSCTFSPDRSVSTPRSESSEDMLFNLDGGHHHHTLTRKRAYEDDDGDAHLHFHLPAPFTDSVSSLSDFSTMPYSKLLCAS
ncbi:hypothetical protein ABEF93_004956 [Exophiala dermatitidis]